MGLCNSDINMESSGGGGGGDVIREEEMTCVINIPYSTYVGLLPLFINNIHSFTYTKTCYPSNIRLLTYDTSSVLQVKKCLSKQCIQTEVGGFLLNIDHTISTESNINTLSDLDKMPILYTVHRKIFFDCLRVRFALDYLPQVNIYRFCFEYEKADLEMKDFICVVNRPSVKGILEMIFKQPISIGDILQSNYTVARPFHYRAPLKEDPVYYARKLDGVKYPCIIRPNEIIIPTLIKSLHFLTNLKQTMYGCVEVINDKFYVIDINYVLCETGLYFEVGHLVACGILRDMEIFSKSPDVEVNQFFFDLESLQAAAAVPVPVPTATTTTTKTDEIYDGYLIFYKTAIVKHKHTITVDLYLSCTKKYKKKADVERSLKFFDGETIRDCGYRIENFPLEMLTTTRQRNRQFYIIEFKFNKNKKTIDFLRVRDDKAVANKLCTFKSMEEI